MQSFQSFPDHAFKKRKSRSPSPGPACKRRVPASYTPSLYASVPPSLAPRSLSVEALASGTPTSERSSPGLDWLHQTQQLHLQTPPLQEADRASAAMGGYVETAAVGGGGEGQDDAMEDDPPPAPEPAAPFHPHSSHQSHHIHPISPHPHHPPQHTYSHPALSTAGFAFADPTFMPVVPSPVRAAPHEAPPLHHHLAGSPQPQALPGSNGMTPSSSTSSIYASMAYGQGLPHVHELAMEQDTSMGVGDAGVGKAGQGGWKLTMGFRQDCEKCRNREPGHYSHLVPPH
ncbi:hypothetical protein JCM6882_009525 [Rhodosporidiobolus microsporus]